MGWERFETARQLITMFHDNFLAFETQVEADCEYGSRPPVSMSGALTATRFGFRLSICARRPIKMNSARGHNAAPVVENVTCGRSLG
jgi:hypothetical protein